MASAGRVLLISKGTWASGSSYKPMDFVYYGGNSYLCKVAVSGSTPPSSDTSHWQIMAAGFDVSMISQEIVNDSAKVPSSAAVYELKTRTFNSVDSLITNLNALEDKFDLVDTGEVGQLAIWTGANNTGIVAHSIRYALNEDKTVGKIYGFLRLKNVVGTGGRISYSTGLHVAEVDTAYVIHGIFGQALWGGSWKPLMNPYITVSEHGVVGLSFIADTAAQTYDEIVLELPACLYFFDDFGDPADT